MARLAQIFTLFITVHLFENTISISLFKGISLRRAFDFSFIPMERNPISYIRERWSPFGVFGVRRTIAKRDLESVIKESDGVTLATVLPPGHVAVPYLQITPRPPSPVYENPDSPPVYEKNYETILKGIASVPRTYSLPPPFILIATPNAIGITAPPPGLHTDISRAPLVNDYLNLVQPPPEPSPASTVVVVEELPPAPEETPPPPPPPPVVEKVIEENSIFSKSKLAFHLGKVFLKLVSQFFENARFGLSQLVVPRAT